MIAPTIAYSDAKRLGVAAHRPDAETQALTVAIRDGADRAALLEVRRLLGEPFAVETLPAKAFDRVLEAVYGAQAIDAHALSGDFEDDDGLSGLTGEMPVAADLLDSNDDAPVIRLINQIIGEAARKGASDIHIEPYEDAVRVRMRLDGVLQEVLRLPANTSAVLVSRIKVMARLDIAERRVPQDGRITLMRGERALDVRVSTLPARSGERVVMRVLDRDQADVALDDLGMPSALRMQLEETLTQPNGIILVTGPTGSGKTTSLYAALRLLNDGRRNILTVEDPVEYAVPGVGQTQVDTKVGMTFAAGLRAILRQDPDVIMVGEIRDFETAEIAIQASLTGHMVLSSVHTNDAVGAITRLADLGVEPFLLGSSIRMVLAQRLVRRLCTHCRIPSDAPASVRARLSLAASAQIYSSEGCNACDFTGYRGRIGVFEHLAITPDMRDSILKGASESALEDLAREQGGTLKQAAAALVARGETSLEEALRVVRIEATDHAAL